MTSSFVNVVIVNVVGIGMVIAVDDTMTVSRVVIGTITVWIVVPSEDDLVLLKDGLLSIVARSERHTGNTGRKGL
jgi:hypothetical protein